MQLPQYKKKKRIKLKVCQFPDCGKEFWGHPIAKYCVEHQNIKFRLKAKKALDALNKLTEEPPVDENNKEFKHTYTDVTPVEFTCALDGCDKKFIVKIFPKQDKYPKYCPEHRNPHKRMMFTKMFGPKKD